MQNTNHTKTQIQNTEHTKHKHGKHTITYKIKNTKLRKIRNIQHT